MQTRIRGAELRDLEALLELRGALWPDAKPEEDWPFAQAILEGRPMSTLPLVMFVAEDDGGKLVGFVEVGLRSHADGCDGRHAVGFIEGWYVAPEARRRGVGTALIAAAEAWSRAQGCIEMASDTWADSEDSERAHLALGFEVVDRCINFSKKLTSS